MQPLVVVDNLYKRYGGVVALDHMNLTVAHGTIHAVVGENGAGKSTLMKVLAGAVTPDSGKVQFDGKPIQNYSPQAAKSLGIAMFFQELTIFPQRSVLANLFPNREPTRFGMVSSKLMATRSRDMLAQLGLKVDIFAPAGSLSIGEQQLVELCRVMLENPRLLILDEPNSALNEAETERLFTVLRGLRERGVTLLYISHRLEEVFAIADTVTVARNGRDVFTKARADLSLPEVIEGMIGGHQTELFPPRQALKTDAPRHQLLIENLQSPSLKNISLQANSGEIIGLAGLEGAGVSTLLGTLFGTSRAVADKAILPDGKGLPKSPYQAANRQICLVPADRKRNGLMLEKNLVTNLAHVTVGTLRRSRPYLLWKHLTERAAVQIQHLRIKARSPQTLANQLSGGNQQKVVVGKWLESAPMLVLLDDPTRGVDVGAKREIYGLIRQLAAEGRIVLFSSTELPELVGLCDRIIVLYRGQTAGELVGEQITEHNLLHMMNVGHT